MVMNQKQQILKSIDELEAETLWYAKNLKNIREKHKNEFVAIKNKEIIASNPKYSGLLKELKKKNEDPDEVAIEFVPGARVIFAF